MTTWLLGLFYLPIAMPNGIVAPVLMVMSVALYEWARHTIWRRRFGIAFADQVPEEVCADGPYRWVRHPLYVSYVLAYLAVLVALPHWLTASVLAVTIALFAYAARSD